MINCFLEIMYICRNIHILSRLILTAKESLEEGGDHGKSSWPLRIGLLICYIENDKEEQR